MVLIGVMAKRRHGKDTMADLMVDELGFSKYILAGPLKEACRTLFLFDDDQLYGERKEEVDDRWGVTPRQVLQYIGTDVIREDLSKLIPWVGNRFWLERFQMEYTKLKQEHGNDVNVVVSDVRFANEVEAIHKMGGLVVKVHRHGMDDSDNHSSEKQMDSITDYDYLIENDATLGEYLEKVRVTVREALTK